MVARSCGESRHSRALVAQKNNERLKPLKLAGLSKGQVEAGSIQGKSFKKDLDKMRIWSTNSENIAYGNGFTERVETTQSPGSYDARSKFLGVMPNVPLATERDVLDGHEEHISKQYIDLSIKGQKKAPKKGKIMIRHRLPNVSRIAEQEGYISLQARIKALKEENRRLRSKLQDEAKISLQLKDENTNLLDNLRQKYPPDVIASLEAENPDQEMPC